MKEYWNKNKIYIWIGLKILIGILLIGEIASILNAPLIIGPLAASCGLVFTVPHAPAARARNVILGHLIAVVIGLVALHFLGATIFAISITGALSVVLMELTKNVHPPACATAVITVISQAKVLFVMDVAIGASALILAALLLNNLQQIKNRVT